MTTDDPGSNRLRIGNPNLPPDDSSRVAAGNTHYDVIVVGVGGMGSAATFHLARRGAEVLGLERFDIPHARGSSHGSSRIIRRARYVEPAYVSLLERSYELWEELDASVEGTLFHRTGYVAASPPDGDVYSEALDSGRRHGFDHERLSAAELAERFPGYELPPDFRAIFDPSGGFLHAEQCVVAQVEAAIDQGAEVHGREAVLDWSSTGAGGIRVETDESSYTADRLVVTAGAWVAELLPELRAAAVPERQVLGWFQPSRPERFEPDAFPVFSIGCEEGHFYGCPIYRIPGVKVGKHNHLQETVDPDSVAEPNRTDERALRAFTDRYLPGAAGPTMTLETCLFTNSPDEAFIIDRHPEHPRVAIGAGFSGHGFKMSAAIGEVLARLALEEDPDHPLERFRVDRL